MGRGGGRGWAWEAPAGPGREGGHLNHLLMPRSHQTFRPVLAVKLLGIILRNRCWSTPFHTITTEDAERMVLELTGVISPSQWGREGAGRCPGRAGM